MGPRQSPGLVYKMQEPTALHMNLVQGVCTLIQATPPLPFLHAPLSTRLSLVGWNARQVQRRECRRSTAASTCQRLGSSCTSRLLPQGVEFRVRVG